MTGILDTTDGTLYLPSGPALRAGLLLENTTRLNLSFIRAIDLMTGWSYRTIEPELADGHCIYFALGFEDRHLATVEFGFAELAGMAGIEQRREYDIYLSGELGSPAHTTVAATRYDFTWGKVTSYYDPRTDAAGIIVRWS